MLMSTSLRTDMELKLQMAKTNVQPCTSFLFTVMELHKGWVQVQET